MKISLFAYSRQGCLLGKKIAEALNEAAVEKFAPQRISGGEFKPIPESSEAFYGEKFKSSDALIFVGSCGIAVRLIAPFIKNKTEDPAVIAADELGRFIIPVLSGHIGGANELAEKLAERLGAQAVITTATDINKRFSPDSFAKKNGLIISDMEKAKKIAAAILEENVGLSSELHIKGALPAGLELLEGGKAGIYLGCRKKEPYDTTLRLIPQSLILGIGCRRGTDEETVREAFLKLLSENKIDKRAIKAAASIDLKRDEKGLLEFCEKENLPIEFYSAPELMELEGKFSSSEFVLKTTGADNVCERAAAISGGKLIVEKTAYKGVTLALAEEKTEVSFGKA